VGNLPADELSFADQGTAVPEHLPAAARGAAAAQPAGDVGRRTPAEAPGTSGSETESEVGRVIPDGPRTHLSNEDIYRKIRQNHRKAKHRDREQSYKLALLTQKVKMLYIQISALGVLLAGDIVAHYFAK
jgi:hypothetical protein